MNWTAECTGCRCKLEASNRRTLNQLVKDHKAECGHKMFIAGQLRPKEVERCKNSGRTYLAAIGLVK